MKTNLKARLFGTFLAVVLIPIMLFSISIMCLTNYQRSLVLKNFGIQSDAYGLLTNSVGLFSSVTDDIFNTLVQYSELSSEKLEDKTVLREINAELSAKSSFLIVRKDKDIYYTGDEKDTLEVLSVLPSGNSKEDNKDGEVYLRDSGYLIKQVCFDFSDGSDGSAFIITHVNDLVPQMKSTAVQLCIAFIIILVITGLMLVSWIYRTMVAPLRQITDATQKVAEGELDFEISIPRGDDEIATLCRNFDEMRIRLKRSADKSVESESENRTLISNITHDLKTPVTSIKGYAEGILDGVADTPEKQERYVRTILNKANDMNRLINELTFYSGIDTNRIPYNFARINISDYFDDCVDEIGMDLDSQNIELNYMNYLDRGTQIIADPEQLKKVINNIIGNSVKYMDKSKGVISIRLKDQESSVVVEIEDNGKGIDVKDIPYIFDRFYRSDASRNSARGGSGIGLSIVKKIVEDHGGRVWATSHPGTGTTILIEFRKYIEVKETEDAAGDENEHDRNVNRKNIRKSGKRIMGIFGGDTNGHRTEEI